MSDDKENKRIPTLSRDNHESWFRRMQLRLEGKELFYVIETTREEFAWILREGGAVPTPKLEDDSASSASDKKHDINKIISDFERMCNGALFPRANVDDEIDS